MFHRMNRFQIDNASTGIRLETSVGLMSMIRFGRDDRTPPSQTHFQGKRDLAFAGRDRRLTEAMNGMLNLLPLPRLIAPGANLKCLIDHAPTQRAQPNRLNAPGRASTGH